MLVGGFIHAMTKTPATDSTRRASEELTSVRTSVTPTWFPVAAPRRSKSRRAAQQVEPAVPNAEKRRLRTAGSNPVFRSVDALASAGSLTGLGMAATT